MTSRPRGVARAAAVASLLAALCALLAPAGALATGVSTAQLHALAARAAGGDTLALAELRTVTTVDGRPAQVAAALDTTGAQQLKSRLVALSGAGGGGAGAGAGPGIAQSPEEARRAASELLASRRFGNAPVPNPVGSLLDKLARRLGRLAQDAPGGPALFWGALAGLVLALTALGTRRMIRRLDPVARARASAAAIESETPESLERDAQAAEARGAFGDAVRLRFRAGLLSLSARRAIDYRPSLLTTDVARRLHSPQFDELAQSFERIAYGGAPAGEDDASAAREGWQDVLAGSGRG